MNVFSSVVTSLSVGWMELGKLFHLRGFMHFNFKMEICLSLPLQLFTNAPSRDSVVGDTLMEREIRLREARKVDEDLTVLSVTNHAGNELYRIVNADDKP